MVDRGLRRDAAVLESAPLGCRHLPRTPSLSRSTTARNDDDGAPQAAGSAGRSVLHGNRHADLQLVEDGLSKTTTALESPSTTEPLRPCLPPTPVPEEFTTYRLQRQAQQRPRTTARSTTSTPVADCCSDEFEWPLQRRISAEKRSRARGSLIRQLGRRTPVPRRRHAAAARNDGPARPPVCRGKRQLPIPDSRGRARQQRSTSRRAPG